MAELYWIQFSINLVYFISNNFPGLISWPRLSPIDMTFTQLSHRHTFIPINIILHFITWCECKSLIQNYVNVESVTPHTSTCTVIHGHYDGTLTHHLNNCLCFSSEIIHSAYFIQNKCLVLIQTEHILKSLFVCNKHSCNKNNELSEQSWENRHYSKFSLVLILV